MSEQKRTHINPESLTSNLSAELRSTDYNDESDGHVRFRAADEIDRLTARNAELVKALRKLGRHDNSCRKTQEMTPSGLRTVNGCTCGLDAALKGDATP